MAEHVSDAGLAGKADRDVWSHCLQHRAALLTKDEDFLDLCARLPGSAVIWFTIGNTPNRVLLQRMEILFPQICDGLAAGETILRVE